MGLGDELRFGFGRFERLSRTKHYTSFDKTRFGNEAGFFMHCGCWLQIISGASQSFVYDLAAPRKSYGSDDLVILWQNGCARFLVPERAQKVEQVARVKR